MAHRVMEQIRSELYLDQRYLNAALGALPPAPLRSTQKALATDGATCITRRNGYCSSTAKNRRYLPRAYLHSLFHCILRHLWLRDRRDPALWGLACDITVEHLLDSLGTPATTRPVGWLRSRPTPGLKAECKLLAAGPVSTGYWLPPTPPPCRNTGRNLSVTTTGCGPPTLTVPPPGCGASSGSRWADRPS